MKKQLLLLSIAGILFTVAPALAEIKAILDTPDEAQKVSGKTVVSGWAFSTNNVPVTVSLLVNGTLTDVVIPCCGPRADVQGQNPGAPLNSGFGLLLNYGVFDPATLNAIGVQITAPGETPLTINHAVMVAKPGARSADADPTLFSFLQQLSASGARAALDGEELIVAPVTVTDSGIGGTRQSTLRLLWTSNSQTFGIIAAASGTSFDGVQAIFSNSCATAQCHDNATKAGELDLSEGKAFKRIVAVKSSEAPDVFRVNPGKTSVSYLYQKIILNGDIPPATSRMPPACANNPSSCLSDSDTQAIAGWIDEGAPPPQQ